MTEDKGESFTKVHFKKVKEQVSVWLSETIWQKRWLNSKRGQNLPVEGLEC